MTIRELIAELYKMDQDMPVCGQSETCTWDMEPSDLVPESDVVVAGELMPKRYPVALILGYTHR